MKRQEMEKGLTEIKELDLKRHYKYNPNEDYVFISYSSKDKLLVWNVVKSLMDDGYNVFVDKANLSATQEFDRQLLDAANNMHCKYCLFFNSEDSLISEQVKLELEKARIENVLNISIFNSENEDRVTYHKKLKKENNKNTYIFTSICERTHGIDKANMMRLNDYDTYRDFIEMLEYELEESIGVYQKRKNNEKVENVQNVQEKIDLNETNEKATPNNKNDIQKNIKENNKKSFENDLTEEYINLHKNDADILEKEASAEKLYTEFFNKFSPEKLKELNGINLLRKIFLNDEGTQDNICSILEYGKDYVQFGSIKGGTALKHCLYYSAKDKSWKTGKPPVDVKNVTEEEAIAIGTRIRDNIVKACDIIEKNKENLKTEKDYKKLYEEIGRDCENVHKIIFVKKYLHMIYKELFPCMFSGGYIRKVAEALKYDKGLDDFDYIGKIEEKKNQLQISNRVFAEIVYKFFDEESFKYMSQ